MKSDKKYQTTFQNSFNMESQPNIEAPSQNSIDTSKMTVLCRIDNGFLHQFATQKVKQLLDVTRCELLQQISVEGTQVPKHYLKVGSFVQPLENCMIVHVKFSNLITFVFENTQNPNAIYMLSFEVFNPSVEAFSYALRESAQIVEYKSESYEHTFIKERMNLIIGGDLTEEMIENIEYVGPVLKAVGSVLGSVSKSVINPTAKAETMMNNSINLLSQKIVTGQTKQRWDNLKQTASNWNDKMTEMYKPIDNAFKLITSAISQTFNNSENKYIKTIKKLGMATASTLNNSYKQGQQQMASGNNQNPYAMNEGHELSTQNLN